MAMNNNTWEGLDELVRDITKVGSMSKSEARRRLEEIFSKQISKVEEECQEALKEQLDWANEQIDKARMGNHSSAKASSDMPKHIHDCECLPFNHTKSSDMPEEEGTTKICNPHRTYSMSKEAMDKFPCPHDGAISKPSDMPKTPMTMDDLKRINGGNCIKGGTFVCTCPDCWSAISKPSDMPKERKLIISRKFFEALQSEDPSISEDDYIITEFVNTISEPSGESLAQDN